MLMVGDEPEAALLTFVARNGDEFSRRRSGVSIRPSVPVPHHHEL